MDGNINGLLDEIDKTLGLPKQPKTANTDISPLLDRMRGSVRTQESGGRVNAVNPRTQATGLFQVLPENIPAWTQKHLKRRMSVDEFARDPNAQEQVFNGEMGEYLRAAKAKGVDDDTAIRMGAAAWYGGKGAMHRYDDPTKFRPNEPSFREYTSSILGRIKKQQPQEDYSGLLGDIDSVLNGQDYSGLLGEIDSVLGTKPQTPLQESPETVEQQFNSALLPDSPRSAVLVTKGEKMNPLLLKAKSFDRIDLPEGKLFVNKTKVPNPRRFVKQNGFAGLLGKVENIPDTTQAPLAVRTEDANGKELTTSGVSPENLPIQAKVDAQQFPNAAQQKVITPEQAVTERAVKDLGQPAPTFPTGSVSPNLANNLKQASNPNYADFLTASGLPDNPQTQAEYNRLMRLTVDGANAENSKTAPVQRQPVQSKQPVANTVRNNQPIQPNVQQPNISEPAVNSASFRIDLKKGDDARRKLKDASIQYLTSNYNITAEDAEHALGSSPLMSNGERVTDTRLQQEADRNGYIEQTLEPSVLRAAEYYKKRRLEYEAKAANVKNRVAKGENELDAQLQEGLITPEQYNTAQYEIKKAQENEQANREKLINEFGGRAGMSAIETADKSAPNPVDSIIQKYGSATQYYKEQDAKMEAWKKIASNPNSFVTEFSKNIIRAIPKAGSSALKTISIGAEAIDSGIKSLAELGLVGIGGDWYARTQAEDTPAEQRGFYQVGQTIDRLTDEYLPQDEVLKRNFLATVLPDTVGQLLVQIGVGALTGGAGAPTLLGMSQGASAQYEEAQKFGADKKTRLLSALIGGLAAVPDAIPFSKWLAPLSSAEKVGFLSKLTSSFFNKAVKEVGEQEATSLTRQLLKNMAIGGLMEGTQEVSENKINDALASLTYDKKRKVLTITDEDIESFIAGFIGGGIGGSVETALETQGQTEQSAVTQDDIKAVPQNEAIPQPAEPVTETPKPAFELRRDNRLKELGYADNEIASMTGAERQEIIDLDKPNAEAVTAQNEKVNRPTVKDTLRAESKPNGVDVAQSRDVQADEKVDVPKEKKQPYEMTQKDFTKLSSTYDEIVKVLGDTPYKEKGDYSGMTEQQKNAVIKIEQESDARNNFEENARQQLKQLAKELGASQNELDYGEIKLNAQAHYALVEKALKDGKTVPAEVLADYPDLAQKYGKQLNESQAQQIPSPVESGDVLPSDVAESEAPQKVGDSNVKTTRNPLPSAYTRKVSPEKAQSVKERAKGLVAKKAEPIEQSAKAESEVKKAQVEKAVEKVTPETPKINKIREENERLLKQQRTPLSIEDIKKGNTVKSEIAQLKRDANTLSRKSDLMTNPEKVAKLQTELAKVNAQISEKEQQLKDFDGRKVKIGAVEFNYNELSKPAFGYTLSKGGRTGIPIKESGDYITVLLPNGETEEWSASNKAWVKSIDKTTMSRDFDQNDKTIGDIVLQQSAQPTLSKGDTVTVKGRTAKVKKVTADGKKALVEGVGIVPTAKVEKVNVTKTEKTTYDKGDMGKKSEKSNTLPSAPKEQNFETFAKERGYPDDYDTMFQAQLLGGRGLEGKRQSNRSINQEDKAFAEMQSRKEKGKEEYKKEILAGNIIDPSGTVTREKLLRQDFDFESKKLESEIKNAKTGIKRIEGFGSMSHLPNGKLRKGYQRAVDDYNERITKAQNKLDELKVEYEKQSNPTSTLKSIAVEGFDNASFEKELAGIETVRNEKGELLAPNGKVSNLQNETIPKELQPLIEIADKYKTAEEFNKALTQEHLTDLGNRDLQRFGRAISPYATETKDTTAKSIQKDSSLMTDLRLSNSAVYNQINNGRSSITIYRAIPISREKLIAKYVKQKDEILRRDRYDKTRFANSSEHYDWLWNEINRLESEPTDNVKQSIEVGDYVALDRRYAVEHGESNLNGEYQILQKTVPKKDVLWDETDFEEWIYSPQHIRDFAVNLPTLFDKLKNKDILKKIATADNPADYDALKALAEKESFTDEDLKAIEAEVDGDTVTLSLTAGEIVRTAEALMTDKERSKASLLKGQFLDENQISTITDGLDILAETFADNGQSRAEIDAVRDAILEASRENGTAKVIVYKEALAHETFHQTGYLNAQGKALVKRIADFDGFAKANDATIRKAFVSFFKQNGYKNTTKADKAVIVEEMATYIGTGDFAQLGLSETESAEFLLNWFDAYEKQNGAGSLNNFERFFAKIETTQKALRDLRNGQQKEKETQTDVSSPQSDQETSARGTDQENGGTLEENRSSTENGNLKKSKTPQTLRENGINVGDRFYTGITNQTQQAFADKQLDKGVESAREWLDNAVSENDYHSGATTAVALSLMNHYGRTGEIEALNAVADKIVPMLTEAGQAIQAMSLVSLYNPDTAGAYATKLKKQKQGTDITKPELEKAVRIARELSETAQADGLAQKLIERTEKALEELKTEKEAIESANKLLNSQNEKIKLKLIDASKLIRNLKAQVKRLQDLKPRKSKTPYSKLHKELTANRDELLARIKETFRGDALKMVEPSDTLKSVMPKGLDQSAYDALRDLTVLEILDHKSYADVIKNLETITDGQLTDDVIKQIHADAVETVRGARQPMSEEAKQNLKLRNEHNAQADEFINRAENQRKDLIKEYSRRLREEQKDAEKQIAQYRKRLEKLAQDKIKAEQKAVKEMGKAQSRAEKEAVKQAEREEKQAIADAEKEVRQMVRELERQQQAEGRANKAVDKFTDFVVRIGVNNDYSDEAIFVALARKSMQPEEITQAIKTEFPSLSKDEIRKAMRDSQSIYNEAKTEVERYREMVKAQTDIGDAELARIKKEKKLNDIAKRRVVKESQRFYDSLVKSTAQVGVETFINFTRANLLANPLTHIVNIAGNTVNALSEELERPLASLIDAGFSYRTHQRTVQGISPQGIAQSFKSLVKTDKTLENADRESGLTEAYKILLYGDNFEDLTKLQLSESALREKFNKFYAGSIMDGYINAVFRSLSAEDAIFKAFAFRRSLEEQAQVIAKSEKAQDATVDVKQRRVELLEKPTNVMQVSAMDFAEDLTFQNDNWLETNVTSRIKSTDWRIKAATELFVPFTKTPTNIVLKTLERTPLGFAKVAYQGYRLLKPSESQKQKFDTKFAQAVKDDAQAEWEKMTPTQQRAYMERELEKIFTRKAQRDFTVAFSRASMGSVGYVGLGYVLASLGLMAGAMQPEDDDKEETNEFFARMKAGVDAGSIVIGKYRFKLIPAPATKAMMIGATFYEQTHSRQAEKQDAITNSINAVGEVAGETILEQPLLKETKDVFDSRKVFGERVGNFATRIIPMSALLRSAGEVADEEARRKSGYSKKEQQGKTWADINVTGFKRQFAGSLPYLRTYNPVSEFTVPKTERGGILRRLVRAFDPLNTRTAQTENPELKKLTDNLKSTKDANERKAIMKQIVEMQKKKSP